jgi:hypothetical protein
MTTLANIVLSTELLVSSTIPGFHTLRSGVSGDHTYSWIEAATMEQAIVARDPFHKAPSWNVVPLCNVHYLLVNYLTNNSEPGPFVIHDDVVMDFYESRNDDLYWTPLAGCRTDYIGMWGTR